MQQADNGEPSSSNGAASPSVVLQRTVVLYDKSVTAPPPSATRRSSDCRLAHHRRRPHRQCIRFVRRSCSRRLHEQPRTTKRRKRTHGRTCRVPRVRLLALAARYKMNHEKFRTQQPADDDNGDTSGPAGEGRGFCATVLSPAYPDSTSARSEQRPPPDLPPTSQE